MSKRLDNLPPPYSPSPAADRERNDEDQVRKLLTESRVLLSDATRLSARPRVVDLKLAQELRPGPWARRSQASVCKPGDSVREQLNRRAAEIARLRHRVDAFRTQV